MIHSYHEKDKYNRKTNPNGRNHYMLEGLIFKRGTKLTKILRRVWEWSRSTENEHTFLLIEGQLWERRGIWNPPSHTHTKLRLMAWWPVDGLSESYWWVWSTQYINLLLNSSLNGLLGGGRNWVVWPDWPIWSLGSCTWKAFLFPQLLASWATGTSRSIFTPLYSCGMVLSCHDLNVMWTENQKLKTETLR